MQSVKRKKISESEYASAGPFQGFRTVRRVIGSGDLHAPLSVKADFSSYFRMLLQVSSDVDSVLPLPRSNLV